MFNESISTCDVRGPYHMNSDTKFKSDAHLYQEVVPRVRYDGFITEDNSDTNPNSANMDDKRKLDLYFYQDIAGLQDEGSYKIFIKGNPILDYSNILVSYTYLIKPYFHHFLLFK